jgi:hypothetical protein
MELFNLYFRLGEIIRFHNLQTSRIELYASRPFDIKINYK